MDDKTAPMTPELFWEVGKKYIRNDSTRTNACVRVCDYVSPKTGAAVLRHLVSLAPLADPDDPKYSEDKVSEQLGVSWAVKDYKEWKPQTKGSVYVVVYMDAFGDCHHKTFDNSYDYRSFISVTNLSHDRTLIKNEIIDYISPDLNF